MVLFARGPIRIQRVGIMEILSEKVEQGVVEQRFDLHVDGETVPGIRWCPDGAKVPRPTILIGHGGTQHKRVPNVLGLARRFVRHLGYSAVALDAPGHGERTDPENAGATPPGDPGSHRSRPRGG